MCGVQKHIYCLLLYSLYPYMLAVNVGRVSMSVQFPQAFMFVRPGLNLILTEN